MKCIEIHGFAPRDKPLDTMLEESRLEHICAFFVSICSPTFHPKGTDVLISLVGCMVIASVLGLSIVVAFRSYFRSVTLLEEKLQRTSFDTVRSVCCECGHSDAFGNTLVCDREALKFLIVHGETFGRVE